MVSDYSQMDRVLKEERKYILDIVKQIKKGTNRLQSLRRPSQSKNTYVPVLLGTADECHLGATKTSALGIKVTLSERNCPTKVAHQPGFGWGVEYFP